ncbi:MAG: permease-like cell division protein FtsX [Salinivirgaceae bacterium]|jgi:cell division transport system permease protein|nr:permease-like cell division protein FtsX [Salinivirgaceae bacterium]
MSVREQKVSKRKLRSSYLTSIFSISLVLLLIGIIGLMLLNAQKLSRHVKENIGFSVILEDNIREVEMIRLQKNLDALKPIKSTEYITKEQAARELQDELGEDFIEFLGYNPLLPSIEVKLFAEYANPDSVAKIEKKILAYSAVKEVAYQKSLVEIVNHNIRKLSLILLGFSSILLMISLSLINNTIRLSVYSRRFLIKTMQLVGATRKFVRAPFIAKSLSHAFYSIILTYFFLGGIIYAIATQIPELAILSDVDTIAILFAVVMIIGFVIVWLSTWFAVNKYLRLRSDELYY